MTLLLFVAALAAIALFGVITNRLTGTKPNYLETLELARDERELWRDTQADFARPPRFGGSLVTSYPRLRRHTVVWTNRRLIVAQKVLFSSKRLISQQIYFERAGDAASEHARRVAREFFGGFYGRGFETIVATSKTFGEVHGRSCLSIKPNEESGTALNISELLIFSDRLTALKAALS